MASLLTQVIVFSLFEQLEAYREADGHVILHYSAR